MNKAPVSESPLIEGPVGALESRLERPADGDIRGIAVICHPHPVHGGTLHNKVVHTLARAFLGQRITALRFNFRGVEKSEGEFDNGVGELQDTLAVIAWARKLAPKAPLWIAGFSFGGAMAVHAAGKVPTMGLSGLISVAPAIYRFAGQEDSLPECPWLIVQGDADELVDIAETRQYVAGLEQRAELAVLAGAEHFFHGQLPELRDTLESFIGRHMK